jgi:hypothetical protein
MRKLLFSALLLVTCAAVGFAQSTEYKKVEFYGGFSHARVDTGVNDSEPQLDDIIDEREGFNGFNTSITGNLTRYFGLKFDLAGYFKNQTFPIGTATVDVDSNAFSFLGGVQVKDNSTETKVKPFVHGLLGAVRARNKVAFSNDVCVAVFPSPCPQNFTDTETGLAGAFGGGLDLRVNDRIDFRVIQFDYAPTRLADTTQHNFRIGIGIAIH